MPSVTSNSPVTWLFFAFSQRLGFAVSGAFSVSSRKLEAAWLQMISPDAFLISRESTSAIRPRRANSASYLSPKSRIPNISAFFLTVAAVAGLCLCLSMSVSSFPGFYFPKTPSQIRGGVFVCRGLIRPLCTRRDAGSVARSSRPVPDPDRGGLSARGAFARRPGSGSR